MASNKTDDAPASPALVVYRDKRYAKRVLYTASMRALQVAHGRIEVKGGDTEAVAYLDKHADFERME